MSKISATVVGDSLSPQGHRLTSLLVTFPRIILAELNTHRMLSKNTASSRAIPFKKMLESIEKDPFIPIAWQKDHKGMQGTEYFTDETEIEALEQLWLNSLRNQMIEAEHLASYKVTKQLVNRLLEPFMWVTALITGTEWDNFFELRCPQYVIHDYSMYDEIEATHVFKSRKDLIKQQTYNTSSEGNTYIHENDFPSRFKRGAWTNDFTEVDWLELNQGQAEIHMMALAEAIWDARNESIPKQLKAGEWHIVFEDKIGVEQLEEDSYRLMGSNSLTRVKIATSMGARTSYTVVGDEKEINYSKMIELHDKMVVAKPFHASPFEHSARAMSDEEYLGYRKTMPYVVEDGYTYNIVEDGWCRNFRGFIQYRHIIETVINI